MLDRFHMLAAEMKKTDETFDIGNPRSLQHKKWAVEFYRVRLMAHLHDTFEFQIGDIAAPLKNKEEFNTLRQVEKKALNEIYKLHDIDPFLWELEIVQHADRYALSYEVLQLMDWYHERWKPQLHNYPASKIEGFEITRNTPEFDEAFWLQDYYELVDRLAEKREDLVR
jgi:5'-deoxynucleotidase YfbR-like HD superfamily hydrolase